MEVEAVEAAFEVACQPLDVPRGIGRDADRAIERVGRGVRGRRRDLGGMRERGHDAVIDAVLAPLREGGGARLIIGGCVGEVDLEVHRLVRAAV